MNINLVCLDASREINVGILKKIVCARDRVEEGRECIGQKRYELMFIFL